jgi:hypothetical protein
VIPVGKRGRIARGKYSGWFVIVEDDEQNTGGHSILISKDFDSQDAEGYDHWVEKQDLEQFFEEADWGVEWLD